MPKSKSNFGVVPLHEYVVTTEYTDMTTGEVAKDHTRYLASLDEIKALRVALGRIRNVRDVTVQEVEGK